jgi:hypothetical protein
MLAVDTCVTGSGRPTAVRLLGGCRPPSGFLPSGRHFRQLLSPNPDHPSRIVRSASEPATIGVTGEGSEPGVGRWLFTPAPWCFAVSLDGNEWAAIGLAAPIETQNFTQLHYEPVTDGFSLRLDYDGQSTVDGTFALPTVLFVFGATDPYKALERHRQAVAPTSTKTTVPAWWREPIFCGWGAQDQESRNPKSLSTQQNYDRYLAVLEQNGVKPGIVTVDDKWQQEYATNKPDTSRWPDLRAWIAEQHGKDRRVLLWWKAWDPEGAPPQFCVRTADGRPVALDPSHPGCRAFLREVIGELLSPDGLAADGLKIDFTARTPSGASLVHNGPEWGAALLHRLLRTVYQAAKQVNPEALIVTHTPDPAFADVTDMIRLNDARMLDAPDPTTDVVRHMTYRARVVRAACPDTPIDTDGWSMPDRRQWREYTLRQQELGIPSLYYVDRVGDLHEPLTEDDYRLVRDTWTAYRSRDEKMETASG